MKNLVGEHTDNSTHNNTQRPDEMHKEVSSVSPADSQATLYIVATPIGNLADISSRALQVLREEVAYVACEDTRHSGRMLQHFGISTALRSLHAHNEAQSSSALIEQLQQGKSVALISDAGTPLISDPGMRLVAAAHQAGIRVIPIPGACAAITALSASGFCSQPFIFVGFLLSKGRRRHEQIQAWLTYPATLIFYESPHRILDFFSLCKTYIHTQRRCMLAREISKRYETIVQGSAAELYAFLQAHPQQCKGEFVVIIEHAQPAQLGVDWVPPTVSAAGAELQQVKQLLQVLLRYMTVRDAAQACSALCELSKNTLYDMALAIKQDIENPPEE